MSLGRFSTLTRRWFEQAFPGPTPAQEQGWAAISEGRHTLISAPTGSGKTLAAFLWAIDRLLTEEVPDDESRCRVVYVSPLKALTYDVERNLRAPLTGIALEAERAGVVVPGVRVATRTGDTLDRDRRHLVRRPPDILVTTPESLYLMLTSNARTVLRSTEVVIVDEIHAVAGTKRGAHLALTLERLEREVARTGRRPPQRIGLSATQRPLETVARFLGGRSGAAPRPVTVVDVGSGKAFDLEVTVPVEDMAELSLLPGTPGAEDPEARVSIWPAVHPVLLDLIRRHRSTIVFVNSRRLAERLAARLNELAGEDLVRAHHGSIAREQRVEIEDALKAGRLPALVATSSLELGIDMGAVDLVVHVEAPPSVASGMQRVGRACHRVGEPSRGRIIPKHRGDLVAAAVVAMRMKAGLIEETRIPRNPLDVLAQQVVAMCAVEPIAIDDLHDLVRRAEPFAELSRAQLENICDMLAGRYADGELEVLKPRLNWDRVGGLLSARSGARTLAVVSGGTIPDRGLFGVFTPEGTRVGELDEEFVYESRVGERILLGATTWRVEEITRDRVVVTPAPGEPGKMPFWHGDGVGRPVELGRAMGEFLRDVRDWSDDQLREMCALDERAVRNLRCHLADQEQACGALPTDRQIVVERFRDEVGDWRVCVLTPFGARVHAPWAIAVEACLGKRLGLDVRTMWSDDGFVVRLPDGDQLPSVDDLVPDPEGVEDLVVSHLADSALFAARFRENAARALLLPRRRPGSRTPLWQQRQRAADLLAAASRHPSFPILLETYRECLQDTFDLPALVELLSAVRARRVRVVSVETSCPSPFARSLAYAYVASFLYEGDAPLAERRAQALTLDREMLADLLRTEELRELLDPTVVAAVEAELQALDERHRARSVDDAHDLLRRLGDLTVAELRSRCAAGLAPAEELVASRRAVRVRLAGEERLIAAEDAGHYRDGLGVQPPAGVPGVFLQPVGDALGALVLRYARTHGPFLAREVGQRFGVSLAIVEATLEELEARGQVLRGAFRPGGTEREWCHPDVLRTLRRRSLAALRREVEPVDPTVLGRFLPVWHGIGAPAGGVERLWEVVRQLQGVPIPASVLERDVLAPRVKDYSPRLLDELVAAGEVMWVGAGALGRDDGRVVLVLREGGGLLVPEPPGDRPDGSEHERLRRVLRARGASFFRDLRGRDDRETLDALWDLVWAGEVTNDSFAPVRALLCGRSVSRRPRPGALTVSGPPTAQGRWSLVEAVAADPAARLRARAAALLERWGVLTREAVRGEGLPGGFAAVYPVLRALEEAGRARRGYFLAGLGGSQFALPGAVDRLRELREATGTDESLVLAATDPANPYGIVLPWPQAGTARPARVAGAYVVLVDGQAVLYVERGGRTIIALRPPDGTWEPAAVRGLVGLVEGGRVRRLFVGQVDEGLVPHLRAAGFVPTPKGLARYAG